MCKPQKEHIYMHAVHKTSNKDHSPKNHTRQSLDQLQAVLKLFNLTQIDHMLGQEIPNFNCRWEKSIRNYLYVSLVSKIFCCGLRWRIGNEEMFSVYNYNLVGYNLKQHSSFLLLLNVGWFKLDKHLRHTIQHTGSNYQFKILLLVVDHFL